MPTKIRAFYEILSYFGKSQARAKPGIFELSHEMGRPMGFRRLGAPPGTPEASKQDGAFASVCIEQDVSVAFERRLAGVSQKLYGKLMFLV